MTIKITTIIKIQLNHFDAPEFAKAAAPAFAGRLLFVGVVVTVPAQD
jgi:hypothetical protein